MGHPAVHPDDEVMREGMRIESPRIAGEDNVELLTARSRRGVDAANVGSFSARGYPPQVAHIEATRSRRRCRPTGTHIRLRPEVTADGVRPRRERLPAPAGPRPSPSTVRNDHREQP